MRNFLLLAHTRYRLRGMADRVLHQEPPTPEYRQVGWHCIYHEQAGRWCHNPLDCDLVPIWVLTVADAKRLLAEVPFGSGRKHR